jgi:hypothetical protein
MAESDRGAESEGRVAGLDGGGAVGLRSQGAWFCLDLGSGI